MTLRKRQIVARVTMAGQTVPTFLHVRVQNLVTEAYPTAQIVLPEPFGYYNDRVTVELGCVPGNGLQLRFDGYRRDPAADLYPRAVSYDCVGQLAKAAEYFNHEDPFYFGGLTVADLVPSAPNGLATAAQIRMAVLDKSGLTSRYQAANIGSTGRLYGSLWNEFIWKAGTPTAEDLMSNPFVFNRAGESGLDYMHRYDQIEASWNGITDVGAMGGFYRLVEAPNGEIFCVLMGGRPRNAVDEDGDGTPFIFEENLNILSATFQRHYPTGSHVLVIGADWGQAIPGASIGSQMFFDAAIDAGTLVLASDYRYDPSPPSSSMIEWDTAANAQLFGFGMDCETVAYARLLEVARESVTGSVTSAEDWVVGPTQTHIVQGAGGQALRLLTGEKLWCQGVTWDLGFTPQGAPDFSVTTQYLGGGSPDAAFTAIPMAA